MLQGDFPCNLALRGHISSIGDVVLIRKEIESLSCYGKTSRTDLLIIDGHYNHEEAIA